MVTSPRFHGSPGASMKSPEQGAINGSPLSSYPNMYVRQRNTPNKANETFEKPIRRLFQTDAEPMDTSHHIKQPMDLASAKKSLFRNYRDNIDDTINDSIGSIDVRGTFDFSFNESAAMSPGFRERNLKCADADKGLEVIGRGLAKDQKIHWREFWPFLDKLVDISTNEGLGFFEQYLQQRLKEHMKTTPLKALPLNLNNITMSTPVSKICEKLTNLQFARENKMEVRPAPPPPPQSPLPFHAYLCVEKSCQLYAKRLLKPIVQSPNNIVLINDSLVNELSRLRSLVSSYKEDIRFFGVDFRAAHARFAHIVVAMLCDMEVDDPGAMDLIHDTVNRILATKEKISLTPCKNGTNAENLKNTAQLICLLRHLAKRFNDRSNLIVPEILTKDRECVEVWHSEETCDCEWTNHTTGRSNRGVRRKMESLLRLHTESDQLAGNGVNGSNGDVIESGDNEEAFLVK